WLDRARTAAIAKHTNAFKINEDVVIPLERLGEYSDGIERINIELSIQNKLKLCAALIQYLSGSLPVEQLDSDLPKSELLGERANHALKFVNEVQTQWQWLLDNMDAPLSEYQARYGNHIVVAPEAKLSESCFIAFRDFRLRVSIKEDVMKPLAEIFSGKADTKIMAGLGKIHAKTVRGRVFVALHMHAGDGNVHTNIPVNSDDYEMLQTAHKAVARIMDIARSLNGVISGEHGIGITKLEFLSDEEMQPFWDYKQSIDPKGYFNRGKLMKGSDLRNAYTPSFELLSFESLIMEQSHLGQITHAVKDCLRCGKCKPVCSTHVPRANLLYSPRNKILGVGLLAEAFLYEEQTRRGVSMKHFDELGNIGDHCTVCHRCVKPCPVNIDFGDVTVDIRAFLKKSGKAKFNPIAEMGMAFLNAKNPVAVKALRVGVIDASFKAQNLAYDLGQQFHIGAKKQKAEPKATTKKAKVVEQVIHFINRPLPRNVPLRTARSLLGLEDN
ncbi:FAD-linked oxidase C-terminal domain-containing protein, partial [Kingella kingae]